MQIFDCFIVLGCHLIFLLILIFLFLDKCIFKKKGINNVEYNHAQTRIIITTLIITFILFIFYGYFLITWYLSSYQAYLIVEAILYFSLALILLLLLIATFLSLKKTTRKYGIKPFFLVVGVCLAVFFVIPQAFLVNDGIECILDSTNISPTTYKGNFEVLSGGMYEHEGIILENSKTKLISNVEGIYEGSFYGEILYAERSKHALSITVLD